MGVRVRPESLNEISPLPCECIQSLREAKRLSSVSSSAKAATGAEKPKESTRAAATDNTICFFIIFSPYND